MITPCSCQIGQSGQSETSYAACCQPYRLGRELPETPEQLMRARYCAYARALVDYVMKTTHPENPQYDKNPRRWRLALAQYCQQTTFESLAILEAPTPLEAEGWVTFEAVIRMNGQRCKMREQSHFLKVDGRWLYYAGDSELFPLSQ